MVATQLRKNLLPLPATLGRRDLPRLSFLEFSTHSAIFQTLEATIVRPGPVEPRIVSSAHGPLKHLLFTYPMYAAGEYSYRGVYEDLFKKLPQTAKLTILSHPQVTKDLQAVLQSANVSSRATIVESPEYPHFLVWAEDPYVVVRDTSTNPPTIFFIEPYTFPRASDALIADFVTEGTRLHNKGTQLHNTQSPLYFQGGNVLIGEDFVLIGADYPAKTLELIRERKHILVPSGVNVVTFVRDLYQKTFDPTRKVLYVGTRLKVPQQESRDIVVNGQQWREVVYFGTGYSQPIFHIDMFISLAGRGDSGKYRLLVGAPALADKLLNRAPVPHAMSEIFDDIARNLQREGFEVIRNPLPIIYVDEEERKIRTWYFATSNNCLVQIDETAGNVVWLPTYGHGAWEDLRPIDDENRSIWEGLGFKVNQLADFNPFAQNLGSVHCIKKYLER